RAIRKSPIGYVPPPAVSDGGPLWSFVAMLMTKPLELVLSALEEAVVPLAVPVVDAEGVARGFRDVATVAAHADHGFARRAPGGLGDVAVGIDRVFCLVEGACQRRPGQSQHQCDQTGANMSANHRGVLLGLNMAPSEIS